MTNADDEAKKEYAEAGIDLPELQEKKEEAEAEPEEKSEETKPDATTEEAPAASEGHKPEDKALLQTPEPNEPQRKRSIYDDLKDRKAEVKSERALREQAEHERDELKAKIEALGNAETPEEKQEAKDDIEAFAKKINADPAAIREMRDLFLKDAKSTVDPELVNRLKEFEDWRANNSKAIESAAFEDEFQKSQPKLKTLFPKASPEEMLAIKKELDAMSHTKDWHDKPLAYIAFEHQDKLSALVSPRKRGMEGNDRKPDTGETSFEFDPNADLTKLSPSALKQWEADYTRLGQSDGLADGAQGKKIML